MSFDLHSSNVNEDHYVDSSGKASISTYFQMKSNSLGQPFSGNLQPEDRVRKEACGGVVVVVVVMLLMT